MMQTFADKIRQEGFLTNGARWLHAGGKRGLFISRPNDRLRAYSPCSDASRLITHLAATYMQQFCQEVGHQPALNSQSLCSKL